MARRARLDAYLVQQGLAESRQRAQELIRGGHVLVDGLPRTKVATQVTAGVSIRIQGEAMPYVSRGGMKLAAGLDHFSVDPKGHICADLGASTGGFTDCLIQRGAERVYAVDVGYGQLAWKLQTDPRVIVMDRTNVRHLTALPEPVSFVVADLSFISLTRVLPAIRRIHAPNATGIFLIKPQFEVGRGGLGKGGKVRDDSTREAAINAVLNTCTDAGLTVVGSFPCPVKGAKAGNVEELVHISFGVPA